MSYLLSRLREPSTYAGIAAVAAANAFRTGTVSRTTGGGRSGML